MTAPTPRPGILDIVAYSPGKAPTSAGPVYKLSSNESALGPSPMAMAAYRAAAEKLHIYPDAGAGDFREAVGAHFALAPEHIIAGNGSDEILSLLARAYLGPEDSLLMSRHGFAIYPILAKANGAKIIYADEQDLTTHVDALLAAVQPNTKMLMLANPNNPTGTLISGSDMRRLRASLRDDILLVIDAAYAEYVEDEAYEDGRAMVSEAIESGADNVFTTRTFSKLYGLGGLRIGWGYGPSSILQVLNRIRGPFNVSSPAQAAGIAALADKDFVARHLAHNKTERTKLAAALQALDVPFIPSHTNFLLVGQPDSALEARMKRSDALNHHLTQTGTMVRTVKEYFLPDFLRMSIGSTEANDALIAAIQKFYRP